jgi:hypothetical protein
MGGTIAPQASPPAATAHESIDLGDVSPWWTARRQAAGAHPRLPALPSRPAVLLGAAVICAVLAQRLVAPPRLPPETIVLYAIALICLAQGARAMRPALEAAWPGCMPIRLSGLRWSNLAAGLVLLAVAYPLSSGNNLSAGTALLWLGGVWLLCRGLWEGTPPDLSLIQWLGTVPGRLARLRELRLSLSSDLLALLFLTALAAFLRLYRLDAVPAEMTSDHAENILDIRDILAGRHMVFSPRNTGREALLFWATALALEWLPFTFLTLKLVVAVGSILAVPVAYLLVKEWYGREVAFFAAFFLAISKWAITIGRWGLRAGWVPLFVGLTLLFLVRALKYGRRNDFILCGLALGASLYVYTSLRMLPIVVIVLVALAGVRELRHGRGRALPAYLGGLLTVLAVTAAVFVPLGRYMIEYPESFWYRALTRMTDLERPVQGSLPELFVSNLRNSLLMAHWKGDIAWVTNVPGDPFLDPISAGLATLGTVYLLWHVRRGVNAAVLIAYLLLLMPSTLNFAFPQENPSAVRSSTVMPVLFLFPAIPAALTWRALVRQPTAMWRRLATSGLILLLVIALATNARWYFEAYGPQYRHASQKTSDVARAANGFVALFGSTADIYIETWPHWVDHRLVGFQMGDPGWNNLLARVEDIRRSDATGRPRLVIMHPADRDGLAQLRRWYPQGIEKQFDVDGQPYFVLYLIPPAQPAATLP